MISLTRRRLAAVVLPALLAPAALLATSTGAGAAPTATTLKSWNPHVPCKPVLTTIGQILGKPQAGQRGSTLQNGGFKPGVPNREAMDSKGNIGPCTINGKSMFVELHNVWLGGFSRNNDGDRSATMVDTSSSAPKNYRSMHVEVDGDWIKKHIAPGDYPGSLSFPDHRPPYGIRLDIQGFVFWDKAHTNEAWHFYSGWEIHPITAWRKAS
jgi:hypothetical protein